MTGAGAQIAGSVLEPMPTLDVIAVCLEPSFAGLATPAMRRSKSGSYEGGQSVILFRTFLGLFLLALSGYTALVIADHGWNLLAVFFGDLSAVNWQGQFNFDFMGFLALSALWTAWRHHFSLSGLALGLFAFFGGMMFLAAYLLVASYQVKGDVKALLLGPQRASA